MFCPLAVFLFFAGRAALPRRPGEAAASPYQWLNGQSVAPAFPDSAPLDFDLLRNAFDFAAIINCEFKVSCSIIFVQPICLGSAENRNHPWLLR